MARPSKYKLEDKECDKILDIFKKAGMRIDIGENSSVKGQIAQLLNGVTELIKENHTFRKIQRRIWNEK